MVFNAGRALGRQHRYPYMKEFFSSNGLLARKLEDYEPRPSQMQMAQVVAEALEGQTHAIIEAGTGTGKTLAYLAPALMHGRRLLVSTGTKALQDQIFYKDIPLLEGILDRPIRAAYLKGRNNYLCKLKLHTFQEEGLFTPLELDKFSEIAEWASETETGDRAELTTVSDDDELWSRLDARRDRCLGTKCEEFESCFLTLVRQKAMESDIVVVNHHLFFADLSIRESEMAQILPDYTAVIFDEAHELEDIATGYFGFHVSNYRIQELLFDTRSLAQETTIPFESEATTLGRAADHFFGQFLLLRDGRHPLPELESIDELIDELYDLRRAFKRQLDMGGEWSNLARRAGEIANELEIFRDGNPDNYVSWLDRRGAGRVPRSLSYRCLPVAKGKPVRQGADLHSHIGDADGGRFNRLYPFPTRPWTTLTPKRCPRNLISRNKQRSMSRRSFPTIGAPPT